MNPEQMKELIRQMITKTVKEELGLIFKNSQNIITSGTVEDLNSGAQQARVKLLSGGGAITPYLPVPSNESLSIGQRVVLATPDPNSLASSYVLAGYGGSGSSIESQLINNYKISATVASNDLTVAIKNRSNTDPSVANGVNLNLGDTLKTITTTTSKTLAAGTDWFGAGGSKFATKAIDYFVWAILNTTPTYGRVDIGISRYYKAGNRTYADFSTTNTNEKYLAFSGSDTPQNTDKVILIGRFTATLSAGAAYTWSISGNGDVINEPYPYSELRDYVPSTPTVGSMTVTGGTVNTAKYRVTPLGVQYVVVITTLTTGGTANSEIRVDAPFNPAVTTPGAGYVRDTNYEASASEASFSLLTLRFFKTAFGNFGLGANREVYGSGVYAI